MERQCHQALLPLAAACKQPPTKRQRQPRNYLGRAPSSPRRLQTHGRWALVVHWGFSFLLTPRRRFVGLPAGQVSDCKARGNFESIKAKRTRMYLLQELNAVNDWTFSYALKKREARFTAGVDKIGAMLQ